MFAPRGVRTVPCDLLSNVANSVGDSHFVYSKARLIPGTFSDGAIFSSSLGQCEAPDWFSQMTWLFFNSH